MQTKQVQAAILSADGGTPGRTALARLPELRGHTVIEANTGREAVRLARAEQPDLIVVPANLPDMTGVEVIEQLKGDPATAPIPVLYLSSRATAADPVETGADASLPELVEEAALLAMARALIAMGRAQREAARARAEAELRVREMEAVFEAASSPIIVYDEAGVPVRANSAAAAAWGFDPVSMPRPEAAQRLALRDAEGVAVPPDSLPTTRALRGEVVHRERHLFTDTSGKEHVVLHSVSPLREGEGVRGAVAVWHDITQEDHAARVLAEAYEQLQHVNEERETALEEIQTASEELEVANEELQVSQDQLQHEQARLCAVLDALPISVAIAQDPNCHVITLNPAGAELYGVAPGANVSATPPTRKGVPVRHFAEGRELGPSELPMQRAAAEGVEFRDVEMALSMPDGRRVTVLCNAVPIRDHDQRITGAVATVADITARKQMERALREANDRLETRVEERTAELAQANRALQQEVVERARAEEAVQAERQRFNDVLEMLPAYVILLDPDYHVPFANLFFRERFGDSLGRRCFEYLFGRREPCENCETYRVMNSKGPHRWEWTGPDGRTYDIFDFPFTDVDGSPLIMEVGLDITERKQAEAELRDHQEHLEQLVQERTADLERRNAQLAEEIAARTQAEEALRAERQLLETVVDHIPAAVNLIRGDDLRIQLVNPAYQAIAPGKDMVGKTLDELWPETQQSFADWCRQVLATGEPYHAVDEANTIRRTPDGPLETAYFTWSLHRVRLPGDGGWGILNTAWETTARKQAEQERERLLAEVDRQRVWLDTVLEHTDAHLVFLDRDFNFLHVNAAYARACRKAPEEFLGHNHFAFYPHEENEAIFRRVRDSGEPFSVREKPFEFPDMPERGVTYWDWTLMPIRGEDGEVEYLVFSLLDVTEQVRMRERLVEAERGRAEIAERMTAEINHRMKNNLMLLTSVMQMQLVTLPPGSAAADAIQDTMARIASLSVVHEHLYRGQSGKVELCDVLRRVGDVVGRALSAHRVAVTVSGEECYVPSKLGSTLAILANELITNAMKYGGPSDEGQLQITVSLAREAGQLRLRVWNSGNPIAVAFDLAHRSGMGLDLVQGVVAGQLDGSFTIRPHQGGTLAEMSFGEHLVESSHATVEG